MHWSIAGLNKNADMLSTIANGPYKQKSLVPKSPWLTANPLLAPSLLITQEQGKVFVKWLQQQPEQVRQWILYVKYGDTWEWEILEDEFSSRDLTLNKNGKKLTAVAVKAVDRLGNDSDYEAKYL